VYGGALLLIGLSPTERAALTRVIRRRPVPAG